DKLYVAYVEKKNEIENQLEELGREIVRGKPSAGNSTYSELRALKDGETYAVNAVYLHEWYFEVLGGDGQFENARELIDALGNTYGSVESFINISPSVRWRPAAGRCLRGTRKSIVCGYTTLMLTIRAACGALFRSLFSMSTNTPISWITAPIEKRTSKRSGKISTGPPRTSCSGELPRSGSSILTCRCGHRWKTNGRLLRSLTTNNDRPRRSDGSIGGNLQMVARLRR